MGEPNISLLRDEMSGPGAHFRAQTGEDTAAAAHIFDKSKMSRPDTHFRAQTGENADEKEKNYSSM